MRIDLNSDMGESFGRWKLGDDHALLDVVSSANVACGFHAGDPGRHAAHIVGRGRERRVRRRARRPTTTSTGSAAGSSTSSRPT